VFFEMLTGRAPFVAEIEMALCWAHANDPRPTASEVVPTLGKRYDRLFGFALAIEPEQRFASGREFADALAAAHSGADTTPSTAVADAAAGAAATTAQTAARPPDRPAVPGQHTAPPSVASAPPSHPAAYPAYGYVTPLPPSSQPSRSIGALSVVLLVIAMAGIAAGALAAAGVFSRSSSQATTSGSIAQSVTSAHVSRGSGRAASVTPAKASGGGPVAASGTTSCGGDLSVGANTSCGFAANVEQAYGQTSGGEQTVSAYSPATGQTYTIVCSGGSPHVCSGGTTHDASVYFTAGPSAGPPASSASAGAPSSSAASGASSGCDSGISVNSVTTCPFADNVFKAYVDNYKANGVQNNVVVTAYSPVTHQTYSMNCANDGSTVTCTGGKSSLVSFPLVVVQDY
jgi:hypothetical protein